MQDQSIQEFSKDKDLLIKTLTRFDGQISVEDVTGTEDIHASHYHTFFLQVLLEQVCTVVEPDKEKRSILFKKVVDLLSESKFLNKSLVLDNLMPLRRKAAERFFHFVKQVQAEVVPDSTQSNATLESILREEEFPLHLQLKNKYNQHFEELEVIAKGGFGKVCKVKHKLDGVTYAVKKIVFRYKSDSRFLKVIREAKSIATLNHINVVSYNNAWIECLKPSEANSDSESTSKSSNDSSSDESSPMSLHRVNSHSSDSEKYSSRDRILVKRSLVRNSEKNLLINLKKSNFGHFHSPKLEVSNECLVKNKKERQTLNGETESSDDESYDFSVKKHENVLSKKRYNFQLLKEYLSSYSEGNWNLNNLNVKVMLCIQMEYCDCDLYQWLQCRVRGDALPFHMEVMNIFKDILQGVAYIHSRNIIHRDLKPQNIFFSNKHYVMKIGDFGLATLADCQYEEEDEQASTSFSSNLGTIPYAAPEQRNPKKTYDSKVDVYSLGIILIELLNEFPTQMEFSIAIDGILKGKIPEKMIAKWPNHIDLVQNLVQINPKQRLTAKEILNHPLFQDNLEEIAIKRTNEIIELKKILIEKDEEIDKLKKIIEEKNRIIAQQGDRC